MAKSFEGEALKRELFDTNQAIWRQQAGRLPTVLVFDDLHWADSGSTELLAHLFRLTDSVPILFLCAFRPDRSAPSWRVKQIAETEFPHRYKEILLHPLDAGNSRELVDHLLMISELPPKLHAMIQEKSEGNPFFVEEVVRSLIDSGAVEQKGSGAGWTAGTDVDEIQIPDNLQTLLISRVDRLEGEARHTLQLASVIGRSFYYRVLQSISQAVDVLDGHLSVLQRVELIFEAARAAGARIRLSSCAHTGSSLSIDPSQGAFSISSAGRRGAGGALPRAQGRAGAAPGPPLLAS